MLINVMLCIEGAILLMLVAGIVTVAIICYRCLPVIREFFERLEEQAKENNRLLQDLTGSISASHSTLVEQIKTVSGEAESHYNTLLSSIGQQGKELAELCANMKTDLSGQNIQLQELLTQKLAETQNNLSAKADDIIRTAQNNYAEIQANQSRSQQELTNGGTASREAIISAVSGVREELAINAGKSRNDLSTAQNALLQTIKDSAQQQLDAVNKSAENMTRQLAHINFVSDQCVMLMENVGSLKKELLAILQKSDSNARTSEKLLTENIRSILETAGAAETALKRLQADNQELAAQNRQIAVNAQRERMAELHSLESSIAGIQNSLLLVEERLKAQKSTAPSAGTAATPKQQPVQQPPTAPPAKPEKTSKSTVTAANGDRIEFEPQSNGKTLSRTYRNGKLLFEILHSEFGSPEKGTMFSESGKVLKKFEYGSNGQVKK